MENNHIRKEVLLVTSSIHSQKELFESSTSEKGAGFEGLFSEKLEEACWNGLLVHWLPEVIARKENGISLYLWKVRLAHMFLFAEFAEAPFTTDPEYTLDPYLFLAGWNNN
jgi:hypothetical protein